MLQIRKLKKHLESSLLHQEEDEPEGGGGEEEPISEAYEDCFCHGRNTPVRFPFPFDTYYHDGSPWKSFFHTYSLIKPFSFSRSQAEDSEATQCEEPRETSAPKKYGSEDCTSGT